MLTEVWPPDYVPDWPPRWSAGEQPRPLVVYLDQWCFAGRFVRDRAGTLDDHDAGSYQFLRSLALDGSVIFPLSEAHYRENWKRDNADAMWDTAVVMAELSGFHTVNFRGLAEWEALKAVATYTETVVEIPTPEPIGWGMSYCFSGREAGAQIIEQSTGRPVRWRDLPQHAKQATDDLGQSASYLFELAMLARRVPPGWQVDIPPVPPLDE